MQGPKKMAGGGIIAFAGPDGSQVPPAKEEATSTLGDMIRGILRGPEKDGRNARLIETEAERIDPSTLFNIATAMTPSERAARAQKATALREEAASIRGTSVPPAVNEDAKKKEAKPEIQNVQDPTSGIAALMKMAGGMGGGGGGPSREDGKIRQQLLADINKVGPAQTEYMENAKRVANKLENFKSSQLSGPERDAYVKKEFEQNQAYSKPHFDMMQKLLDEERAANNAGKESEVYKMLGKMGGALMSSRGAFGPALGRAVSEGIDYSDKADAARAAAERLRRQATMDLLKARMADEKGDRQSALTSLADRERHLQAADKLEMDVQVNAMNIRGKSAELEAADQRGRERALSQLAISDANNAARAAIAGANQQNAALRLQMGLMGLQQKREVAPLEKLKIKAAVNDMFSGPALFKDADAIQYLRALPGNEGVNLLAKIKSGELSPKDAMESPLIMQAKKAAYDDFLAGTSKSGGSSGVERASDFASRIGAQ